MNSSKFHVDDEEIPVCPICRRAQDLEGMAKFPHHTTAPGPGAPMCMASGKSWEWAQMYAQSTKGF